MAKVLPVRAQESAASPALVITAIIERLAVIDTEALLALTRIAQDALARAERKHLTHRARGKRYANLRVVFYATAALGLSSCGEDRITVPTPVPSRTIRTVELCPDPNYPLRAMVCE